MDQTIKADREKQSTIKTRNLKGNIKTAIRQEKEKKIVKDTKICLLRQRKTIRRKRVWVKQPLKSVLLYPLKVSIKWN